MRNNPILCGVFIACMIFSTLSSTYGNYGKDDSCCTTSTIRVIGNGKVQVNADVALIYAYITQDGVTVSDAMKKVDAILNSIEQVLKQNQISKSDFSTSYFSVYPKYDYTSGTGVIVGYTVYVSLTITIRGIDKDQTKVGDVVEGLANAGVSSVSGVTYDASQPDAAKSLARKSAFADAYKKAQEYAALACEQLTRILNIDETYVNYYPYNTYSSGLQQTNGGNGTTPTGSNLELPAGKVSVVVNVVVTWIVRPGKC